MYRPLQLFIGLRYTKARRRNHFISFISLTSVLGIALGVTALITILSVMNGFESELRQRILGMTSHATISGFGRPLREWRELAQLVGTHERVVGSAPYIRKEVMAIHGQQVHGGVLRGVLPDEEPQVSSVGDKMVSGELDDLQAGEFRAILGAELARSLGVIPGDKVILVAPIANVALSGVTPQMKRFTVSGTFSVGMYEYDSSMLLIHLEDARRLFRMEGEISGLRLKLDDLFSAPLISRELAEMAEMATDRYSVRDWTQYHANFFRAVANEKRAMFIILLLIVAVAAFNIASTLVMVVTDKTTDIAILRTLGANPRTVLGIFIVYGTVIGLVGTLLGLIGGVSLALNVETVVPFLEQLLGKQFLPADIYYINDLRGDLHWEDVALIAFVSFALSIVATIYPALRAARAHPVEALRYE